jgi:hypothetical protein
MYLQQPTLNIYLLIDALAWCIYAYVYLYVYMYMCVLHLYRLSILVYHIH